MANYASRSGRGLVLASGYEERIRIGAPRPAIALAGGSSGAGMPRDGRYCPVQEIAPSAKDGGAIATWLRLHHVIDRGCRSLVRPRTIQDLIVELRHGALRTCEIIVVQERGRHINDADHLRETIPIRR
jgi:hypothetical protein